MRFSLSSTVMAFVGVTVFVSGVAAVPLDADVSSQDAPGTSQALVIYDPKVAANVPGSSDVEVVDPTQAKQCRSVACARALGPSAKTCLEAMVGGVAPLGIFRCLAQARRLSKNQPPECNGCGTVLRKVSRQYYDRFFRKRQGATKKPGRASGFLTKAKGWLSRGYRARGKVFNSENLTKVSVFCEDIGATEEQPVEESE